MSMARIINALQGFTFENSEGRGGGGGGGGQSELKKLGGRGAIF